MAAVAPGTRDEQERARTKLASSFKSRLSLCSSELTGVRCSTRDGDMLLSNTSPINPKIMYGFEATAATVEDPQREPVLLLGTLRQTKKKHQLGQFAKLNTANLPPRTTGLFA